MLISGIVVFMLGMVMSVVTFNNLWDYSTNLEFIRSVMGMKEIPDGHPLKWRAITNPTIVGLCYQLIVITELAITVLCWAGGALLAFEGTMGPAQLGLTLGVMLYLGVFRGIAGEYFLMWLNKIFNGIPDAHKYTMYFLGALILVLLEGIYVHLAALV